MTKRATLILLIGLVVSCRSESTVSAPAEPEASKHDSAEPASSPQELDRRVLPIAQALPKAVFATTSSTPRRCARPHAWRC